jgi:hypothetical protein
MRNGIIKTTNTTNTVCFDSFVERPRYFPRQLMTPAEMTQEQQYFREKLRRHNRLLHGWGVVCGALIRQSLDEDGQPIPWTIEVSTGYILDAHGNEIVIPQIVTYNLRRESVSGHKLRGGKQVDPWCSDVPVDRPLEGSFFIAVCYEECQTRPVRVMPAGCGCDDADCEYSRIRESFVIRVLEELPDTYEDPLGQPPGPWDTDDYSPCDDVMDCLACPADPCVVLAAVEADDAGTLTIDCYTYRRYVLSFATYYYLCLGSEARREDQAEAEKVQATADSLRLLVDESGMQRMEHEMGGAIGAAVRLPIIHMRGVSARSEVGQALSDVTIGDVAAMPLEEFVSFSNDRIGDIPAPKRRPFERERETLWNRAREIASLTQPFRLPSSS